MCLVPYMRSTLCYDLCTVMDQNASHAIILSSLKIGIDFLDMQNYLKSDPKQALLCCIPSILEEVVMHSRML